MAPINSYSVCLLLDQYMSFGISGSNSSTDMIGADVVVVWVKNGVANAVDYILTARQQVSGKRSHDLLSSNSKWCLLCQTGGENDVIDLNLAKVLILSCLYIQPMNWKFIHNTV